MKTASPEVKAERRKRDRARESTLARWCEITGAPSIQTQTLQVLSGYTRRYGLRIVTRWIRRALEGVSSYPSDDNLGRYISGIRRSEFPEDAP